MICFLPKEANTWRNYPSSFSPVIFALGWECDLDLRNNKPNNREYVIIDLPLAEEAGARHYGREGQTIRKVLMDFSIHASLFDPNPFCRPSVCPLALEGAVTQKTQPLGLGGSTAVFTYLLLTQPETQTPPVQERLLP